MIKWKIEVYSGLKGVRKERKDQMRITQRNYNLFIRYILFISSRLLRYFNISVWFHFRTWTITPTYFSISYVQDYLLIFCNYHKQPIEVSHYHSHITDEKTKTQLSNISNFTWYVNDRATFWIHVCLT